jgi:hypothetical protein
MGLGMGNIYSGLKEIGKRSLDLTEDRKYFDEILGDIQ